MRTHSSEIAVLPPASEHATQSSSNECVLLLVGVIVLSTLTDLFFFTGYYASDDRSSYLSATTHVMETGRLPSSPRVGETRLPILIWNVRVALVVGLDAQRIAASYIALHQVLNLLVFLLGRWAFDRATGIVSAYITGTIPILVIFSSMILPDIPLSCFVVLALLFFLMARERGLGGRHRSGLVWMAFCGASVGCAYMCKEVGLILGPFFFVGCLVGARGAGARFALTGALALLAGFALVFWGEYLALSHLTGRPFLRLGWLCEQAAAPSGGVWSDYATGYYPLERLWFLGHRVLDEGLVPEMWQALLAVGVAAYLLLPRRRLSIALLAVWFVAYYTWGSSSPLSYKPVRIQARHYLPVVPLVALMAGHSLAVAFQFISRALPKGQAHRAVVSALVIVVAVAPFFGYAGADARAGKMYRSELISNVASAIRHSQQWRGTPVVLPRNLTSLCGPILEVGTPADLINSKQCRYDSVEQWLSRGGFLYIQRDQRKSRTPISSDRSPFDAFMLAAIAESLDMGASVSKPRASSRKRDGGGKADTFGGIHHTDLDIEVVATFNAPPTRSEGFWQLVASPAVRAPRNWHPVAIYRVRRIPAVTAADSPRVRQQTPGP
ncbi:MAG: phospholipid carrier-dependent glycosyltransferase [Phycisphaerae bacterium]|nr:phospholipid carrier-dependent glycosyltransferase [Phycisphaerae bacterium]